MVEPVLELRNVSGGYSDIDVIRDVTITAAAGESVGLVGGNGAGKSTVMRAIMSLLPRRSGEVRFRGERLEDTMPWALAQRGIGYVHEERRVFARFTVLENLSVARAAQRRSSGSFDMDRIFSIFPELKVLERSLAGRLSGGEQQMLVIARALLGSPDVILLDEPAEGLSPLVLQRLAGVVRSLKDAGLTLLMAEQNRRFIRKTVDRLYVISLGAISGEIPVADFGDDHPLVREFLSVGERN